MCGLVGFVGTLADPSTLKAATEQAARRGPHSHGWAWGVGAQDWETELGRGPLGSCPDGVLASQVVVGHSRLATSGSLSGDAPPVDESQPIIRLYWALAHNGVVVNPAVVAGRPVVVDSEAIAHRLLIGDPPEQIFAECGPGPHAALIGRWEAGLPQLWAVRWPGLRWDAHPLWHLPRDEGVYISSRRFHRDARPLPTGVHRVA